MKKVLFLILLALFVTNDSFAASYVFKLSYKGRKYEKKNEGNEKLRNVADAYLVFDYDGNTFTFGPDVYIIKYWKEKNRKLQETTKFAGVMEAKMVNKSYRTFMTLNSNTDAKKEFLTLIEPNKMVFKRGITELNSSTQEPNGPTLSPVTYVIPFALEGVSVSQTTNDLGERVFQSSYVKGKCNQRWTTASVPSFDGQTGFGYFNYYLVSTMVSRIQTVLTELGYQNLTPDTFASVEKKD